MSVPQLAQSLDGAPVEQPGAVDLADRTPQGLRLAFVLAESGDEVWYAVCDRHRWLSVGDSRALAEGSICMGCAAAVEAHTRRVAFIRSHGVLMLAALFEGR